MLTAIIIGLLLLVLMCQVCLMIMLVSFREDVTKGAYFILRPIVPITPGSVVAGNVMGLGSWE
jgi:hypothetical protein